MYQPFFFLISLLSHADHILHSENFQLIFPETTKIWASKKWYFEKEKRNQDLFHSTDAMLISEPL